MIEIDVSSTFQPRGNLAKKKKKLGRMVLHTPLKPCVMVSFDYQFPAARNHLRRVSMRLSTLGWSVGISVRDFLKLIDVGRSAHFRQYHPLGRGT